VEIRTTQPVVAAGLRAMLADAPGTGVSVVDEAAGDPPADVVLYDVINLNLGDGSDLDRLLVRTPATVIAVDRTLKPELGARARERGVEWAITLGITADDLVQVIEDAVAGQLDDERNVAQEWETTEFLGAADGLSPRESQVLQLVVSGRSNQEIADELYLSINSVKTYIRSTYRKIEVSSRTQAIVWAYGHGFLSEQYR